MHLKEKSEICIKYFVDESGDGVLFNKKGECILNKTTGPKHFMLGLLEVNNIYKLELDFANLRNDLMDDPFFSEVPSLHQDNKKTALLFHAKDDLPEIRREVFQILKASEAKFCAVIKSMRSVYEYVIKKNLLDPLYRYRPDELYDLTVRRLFKGRLHQAPHINVTFARRGK